jgi:GDPmannose 4,6-dehydratase
MDKSYLITGITGFAGPHLANLLISQGHKVYGLIRCSNGREQDIRDIVPDSNFAKIKFIYGDFTRPEDMNNIFKENKFDGVFHLGAQSHPPTSFKDPTGTFEDNALGTIYLADAIAKYSPETRLMFCSTSEVYGKVEGSTREDFPLNPINPYGVSKAAADLYIRERAKSEGLKFFVTRAFSHTGPRRGQQFSISSDAYQIIRIAKGFQTPNIMVGKLESKRTIVDVRDCVAAYAELMNDKFVPGEAYNVGGDEIYSIGEVLNMMLELKGMNGKVTLVPDEKLIRRIGFGIQIPDSTKCRQATGWSPKIKVIDTLKDLLDYWDKKIQ